MTQMNTIALTHFTGALFRGSGGQRHAEGGTEQAQCLGTQCLLLPWQRDLFLHRAGDQHPRIARLFWRRHLARRKKEQTLSGLVFIPR